MNVSTARVPSRCAEARREFLDDVLEGLSQSPKQIPCKYFYDKRGSELFDRICALEEYYLTRTEFGIMALHAAEMGRQIGPGVMLVEFGSGSSVKTRHLLEALVDPVAYVPVDISCQHMSQTARGLARDYPRLEVLPVCADFTGDFVLPVSSRGPTHTAVYFPGSTIGNFEPARAAALLARIAALCGRGGGLLIGIDLKKEPARIEAAYNDSQGVTAQFNLNVLVRINRELGANFDIGQFEHRARYNAELGRVEMDLVCRRAQVVTIGATSFEIGHREAVRTEHSHKYTVAQFARIAARGGLTLHRQWTDSQQQFAVLHFAVDD